MNELLKKIQLIQSKLSVKKDWENPYYKSKYMTLDNIMEQLQPLLDTAWLLVYNYNIDWGVKTIVTDGTDTVYSEFKIQWVTDPQAMWKVITYGRRYNLVSIFNILADEDDDWEGFYNRDKKPEHKGKKKHFWPAELRSLKDMKSNYSFEKVVDLIKNGYEIDEDTMKSVWELYGKVFDKTTWEWRDIDVNDLF